MKIKFKYNFFISVVIFLSCNSAFSQIGINTTTPDISSILDVYSTNKGILLPRMSSVQRMAIEKPQDGLLVYDMDSLKLMYFKYNEWKSVGMNSDKDWVLSANNDTIYPASFPNLIRIINSTKQVGIGIRNPHPSSALHIFDTTGKNVLIPRLTKTQRENIVDPVAGLFVFQKRGATEESSYYYYDTAWLKSGGYEKIWKIKLDTLQTFDTSVTIYKKSFIVNSYLYDSNSALNIVSDSMGILLPRMLKVNRLNIQNPANGLVVFQTDDTVGFYYYNVLINKWERINKSEETWILDHDSIYSWDDSTFVIKDKRVGIGNVNPHSSAILDINSNSKGVLIPRLSTTQKLGIQNPADGLLVYDLTINAFSYYNGMGWVEIEKTENTIKISAEYPNAIIINDSLDNKGTLSLGNAGSSVNWMNYYEWRTDEINRQYYLLYVTLDIPYNFIDWENNEALKIHYKTSSLSQSALSVEVYKETFGTTIGSVTNQSSSTWSTISLNKSDFTTIPNPNDKIIVVLKLEANLSNYVRIGDIELNYVKN